MYSNIDNVKVIGIAAAVSEKWDSVMEVTNESQEVLKRFVKKTGVEGRYSASLKQTTSDFCCAAAERLLTEKNINREDIGVLVFVTQMPDYRIPATACVLQMRLGLSNNCIAFDVNLGCSGFVYGLNILSSLMSTSSAKYGLLLAGDTSAREFSNKQKEKIGHTSELLFGDSGTATLLERSEGDSLSFMSNTKGSGFRAIIAPYGWYRNPESPDGRIHYSVMDDIEVFNFATNEAPEQISSYMEKKGTTSADYDCLVLHQANLMIMKRIAKKTGFSEDKMLVSMNKFANTSSSSIPLTLVYTYGESDENESINALCCGFGVGLSWATVGLSVNKKDILPLVHTSEYFKDGYNLDDLEENNND